MPFIASGKRGREQTTERFPPGLHGTACGLSVADSTQPKTFLRTTTPFPHDDPQGGFSTLRRAIYLRSAKAETHR